MTVQTNIALQLVSSLSPEEIDIFAREFAKLFTKKPKSVPKKTKKLFMPSTEELAAIALQHHRDKFRG